MSAIPVREFFDAILKEMSGLLQDEDPYVCKTAAYGVAKLWNHDHKPVEEQGLINELNGLLSHDNPTVVAAALAALGDITEKSPDLQLTIDRNHAFNLAHILPDCNEWSQIYILSSLMNFVPQTNNDSVALIERLLPRLQHANSSVVLSTVRVIVYLINYVLDLDKSLPHLEKRITPAFVILLSKPPEIQYLALRNCIILLQSRPNLLKLDVKDFLTKYNDPIYIKATKLEIIFLLANQKNIHVVLRELKECATEIDIQIAHKSVRAIGKLAIKIESAADECVDELMDLVSTRVSYIIQEAVIVLKNIFRRYPNRYEGVISTLCDNMDSLDEPEAKAAMVWIIGHYSNRIENAGELLESFLTTFKEDPVEVQLALLTAIVKFFINRPSKAQHLVPKVLGWATEESDNPDVRDRGYMYWRLLSADPKKAKGIVAGTDMPTISSDSDRMSDERLEELELAVGTLATIYLKPIKHVFRTAKVRQLQNSPALAPRMRRPMLHTRQSTPNLSSAGRPPPPPAQRGGAFQLNQQQPAAQQQQIQQQQQTGFGGHPGLARSQSMSASMKNLSLNRSNTIAAHSTSAAATRFHQHTQLPASIPELSAMSVSTPTSSQPNFQQQQPLSTISPVTPQNMNFGNNTGMYLTNTPTGLQTPLSQQYNATQNQQQHQQSIATTPMFGSTTQPETPSAGLLESSSTTSAVTTPQAGMMMMQHNSSGYFSNIHHNNATANTNNNNLFGNNNYMVSSSSLNQQQQHNNQQQQQFGSSRQASSSSHDLLI